MRDSSQAYWRKNVQILAVLLSIWFLVSFGCGILFVDALNQFHLPGTGFKLGFWFAQQGSIYCFVVLVFVYAAWMNRLDRRFGVAED
jgi:putative solute:sodium symporter small subunit